MNAKRLCAAIEQMEAWLDDAAWQPEAEALVRWDQEFLAASREAEKGEGWAALVARAHEAGRRLEARSEALAIIRDDLKAQLEAQDRGQRALKGYGASSL